MAAWLGPESPLSTLLYDAPRSLQVAAYEPRGQVSGKVNVDGTGIAWWRDGERMPLRYVSVRPPWSDANLPALSRRLSSGAMLAAVRSTTPGLAVSEGHVHPFEHAHFAFAHEGSLGHFREATCRPLLESLPDVLHSAWDAVSDSLLLFLTVMRHVRESPDSPLESAVTRALRDALGACDRAEATAALNVIVGDGERFVATRCARRREQAPLFVLEGGRRWPGARLIASEPLDDDPSWRLVPEDSVVTVTPQGVAVEPLA